MATTTRYVNTASTAGGDGTTNATSGTNRAYATMSAAEAAVQGTINSGDETVVLCCGTAADTTAVTINGSTVNGKLIFRANPDDAAGKYTGNLHWSTSHYRLSRSTAGNTVTISDANVTLDGLQIELTNTGGSGDAAVGFESGSTGTQNLLSLRLRCSDTGGGGVVYAYSSSRTINITNCVISKFITNALYIEATDSAAVLNVYNNTFTNDFSTSDTYPAVAAYNFAAGKISIKNNAFIGSASSPILVDPSVAYTRTHNAGPNCAANDSAGGVSITGSAWTSHVENLAGGDLRPKQDLSGSLDGAGQTYANDNKAPETDITGATRATFDIGAFYVEAAPPPIEGVIATTFAGMTVAITGALPIAGSIATTFASMTGALTGTVQFVSIEGDIAATFADTTAAITGVLPITGAISATLNDMWTEIDGALPIAGSLGTTFADMSCTASGTLAIAGTIAATFAGTTAAMTGVLPITGEVSAAFADMTATIAGGLMIAGGMSGTFADMTGAMTGALYISGVISETFEDMTGNMFGLVGISPISGTIAATFGDTTAEMFGVLPIQGSITAVLADMYAEMTGALPIHGSLTALFDDMAATATGALAVSGVLSGTFEGMAATMTGVSPIRGVLHGDMAGMTAAITGKLPCRGAISAIFDGTTLVATGSLPIRGVLSGAFDDMTAQIIVQREALLRIAISFSAAAGAHQIVVDGVAQTPLNAPMPANLVVETIGQNVAFDAAWWGLVERFGTASGEATEAWLLTQGAQT